MLGGQLKATPAPIFWQPSMMFALPDELQDQLSNNNTIITQRQFVGRFSGAVQNMDQGLPNGAGANLHAALYAWAALLFIFDPNAPVSTTQLQDIARLFHERFEALGYPEPVAWATLEVYHGRSVPVTIGQANNLFALDFKAADNSNDWNRNGIPDWWERYYFSDNNINPNAPAPSNNGITILESFMEGLNPIDFYNGRIPSFEIVDGNTQTGRPDSFLPLPLTVKITDPGGIPITNAPVTFTCTTTSGQLQSSSAGTPNATLSVRTDEKGQAQVYYQLPSEMNATLQVVAETKAGSHTIQRSFTESSRNNTGNFLSAPNDFDPSFDPEHPPSLPAQIYASLNVSKDVKGAVTNISMNDKNEAAFAVEPPKPSNEDQSEFLPYQIYTWKAGQTAALPPVNSADYLGEYDGDVDGWIYSLWGFYNLQFLTSSGEAFGEESVVAVPEGDPSLPRIDTGFKPAFWNSRQGPFFLPLPDSKKVHRYVSMTAVSDEGYFGGWGYSDLDHDTTKLSTITGPFGFIGDPKGNYVLFDATPDYDGVKLPDTLTHVPSDFVPVAINSKGWAIGHPFNKEDTAMFWDGQRLNSMKLKAGSAVALNDQGQVIFKVKGGEGGLWENGTITILRNHLSPYFRDQLQNIQPYALSNQGEDSVGIPRSSVQPTMEAGRTIYMLATAQEKGKEVTLVCSRDSAGEWTFSKIQQTDEVSIIRYVSINSSGIVAAIGSFPETTAPAPQGNSSESHVPSQTDDKTNTIKQIDDQSKQVPASPVPQIPSETPAVQSLANSGFDKRQAGDYDGAIADLTKAIEQEPDNTFAYLQRAVARESKNDLDGAIADYTNLIKINGKLNWSVGGDYEARGALKQLKGDFKGATDDYTTTLKLCTDSFAKVTPYYLRGMARYCDGDLQGALADFRACTNLPEGQDPGNRGTNLRPYLHIDIWITMMKLGQKTEADQELKNYLDRGEKEDLERQQGRKFYTGLPEGSTTYHSDVDDIGHFLLNDQPEPGFSSVNYYSSFYEGSHLYYAGMKALLSNDKDAAIGYFEKYLAAEKLDPARYDYLRYNLPFSFHRMLSIMELKRLKASR